MDEHLISEIIQERFTREAERMEARIEKLEQLLRGGNGDTEGLCEKIRKNTEFRMEMQELIKKLNYRIWALIATAVVILLRDVIAQALLK